MMHNKPCFFSVLCIEGFNNGFHHAAVNMGYLQIISMPTNGALVPVDHLIHNTPVIWVHCETEGLSEEMSQILPEQ